MFIITLGCLLVSAVSGAGGRKGGERRGWCKKLQFLRMDKTDTKARAMHNLKHLGPYTIEPAFDAIRGHMSAHSFATGPATAEPFISPLLFTITPALSSK